MLFRSYIEIDAADNASRLDCSTQNKWSAISHAKIIELDCMYLENSLQEAKRTIVAADSEDGKLHRVIESSHKELQVLKAQFEFDIAAANDEAENKVLLFLSSITCAEIFFVDLDALEPKQMLNSSGSSIATSSDIS